MGAIFFLIQDFMMLVSHLVQKGWHITCKSQGIFLQHKDEVPLPIPSVRNLILWIYTVTYILQLSANMIREQISFILFSSTNSRFKKNNQKKNFETNDHADLRNNFP